MGLLSKFENKMEDGIEGAAGALGRSSLSPVQITKKAEKQMRREKIVGAGKQYAPTLYTVLVSPEDDSKLFKYYPTLAGETETYLMAKAREMGYVMDGQPLVRFLSDPQLKKGKLEVVAEMVAASIVDQLRDDEMARYGLPSGAARRRVSAAQRERNLQPNMQPLPVREPEPDVYADAQMGAAGAMAGDPRQAAAYGQPAMQPQMSPMPQPYADPMQQAPIQRQPMSAADMNVPSVLGSQVSEVQLDSSGQGRGGKPRPSVRRGPVDPSQLLDDVQMAEQVGAAVADDAAGGPIVVVPALSEDIAGAAGRGSGVDAVFGDKGSASTVDIDGQQDARQAGRQGGRINNVFLYDEARDRAYKLTGDRQNIGRESANEIVVPDINISRVHAEIHMQPNGQWVVTDLGSTNGLYVNGQKVQSANLKDADMITIGTSTLEFQQLP